MSQFIDELLQRLWQQVFFTILPSYLREGFKQDNAYCVQIGRTGYLRSQYLGSHVGEGAPDSWEKIL
jgi:hypothetical protein